MTSAAKNVAGFFCVFLIFSSLFITFLTLKFTTKIFTVDGKLLKIESCYESCYTNGVDGGCFNTTVVAFGWIYQNASFNTTDFNCGIGVCRDCCYSAVNTTIQVEIDPKRPSIPIRFWLQGETPYSIAYDILSVITGVCSFVLLIVAGVGIWIYIRERHYQQLD